MCAQQGGGLQEPTHASTRGDSDGNNYPLKVGGLFGAGAFLAGYIVTFVALLPDTDGIDDLNWEGVGMVFYNAQFVRLDVGEAETLNTLGLFGKISETPPELTEPTFFDTGMLTFPVLTYTVFVALVVVCAGFLMAKQTTNPRASTTDHMLAGTSITAGYLPLAFLGTFIFEAESILGTTGTISPDVFAGVFIAGILFPLVFGTLGGYLFDARQ